MNSETECKILKMTCVMGKSSLAEKSLKFRKP